ncbi:lysosome-associated membrane glycoprotein 1 [Eublepharis macularius]|uniref:Lysosome-associated membrane glycoprotein 1 n=1 Tax=Eublepharis macularius TaxID=481883 RepID=A0AA97J1U2_EUBMA|nr:lysosome-associated membrane glycoprotein 1 [Eublepharis macularius]
MAARSGRGLLLLTAVLLGLLQSFSTFEVKEDDNVCILANFSVEFTVEYEAKSHKENKSFELPHNATVLNISSCGKKEKSTPVLAVGFGKGHSLILDFEKGESSYSVKNLTFKYNVSDTSIFPNSTEKGIKEATSETDMHASLNTTYTCIHNHRITMANVTVLFSHVTLEAYLASNNFSHNHTVCKEDLKPTTAAPTTNVPTTTSQAPPTPSKNPDVGHYNLTGHNGTCLLALMALQLNVTYKANNKTKLDVLNFPSNTTYSGTCNNVSVTLNMSLDSAWLVFHFVQNTSIDKYFLQGVGINIDLPSESLEPKYSVMNNSLSELKATVGKSYKCFSEEHIWVSERASVNLFNVQLQAFKFEGNSFGAVEECQLDENNMLIPIIVGAALAGLVLIVLIAYLIGRKRSHAGYQTI